MSQPCSTDNRGTERFTRRRPFLKGLAAAGVILVITVMLGAYLSLFQSEYRTGTELLFFDSVAVLEGDAAAKSSLDKELEMLMSSAVVFVTAREIFSNDSLHTFRHALRMGVRPVAATGPQDDAAFIKWAKWLAEARTLQSTMSGGVMTVKLGLRGSDPAVLNPVLDAYVNSYVKHRRQLAQMRLVKKTAGLAKACSDHSELSEDLKRQLLRIDWQISRCELALARMSSSRGVFSGFLPEGEKLGLAGMQLFQERIVQLELEKAELGVQFKAGGREIRAVNHQIASVKKAMRECLSEHLQAFQKGRADIRAKMLQQGEVRQSSNADQRPVPHEMCQGMLPRSDGWVLIGDGLYMIRDKSFYQEKPFLARVQAYQSALMSSWRGVTTKPSGPCGPTASSAITPAGSVPVRVCKETQGRQGSDRRVESGRQ